MARAQGLSGMSSRFSEAGPGPGCGEALAETIPLGFLTATVGPWDWETHRHSPFPASVQPLEPEQQRLLEEERGLCAQSSLVASHRNRNALRLTPATAQMMEQKHGMSGSCDLISVRTQ